MGAFIDLTGQKFGTLTAQYALRKNKRVYWHCLCDCGLEKDVESGNLRSGRTKSCGCQRNVAIGSKIIKNLSGEHFGKLTVLCATEERQGGAVLWKCQCDCGNITYVTTGNLKSGHTMSCGCNKSSNGELKIAELLLKYNIPFETQKSFDGCVGDTGCPLRFDFYVDKRYIIEYDGEQHFKCSGRTWDTKENFEKTKKI